MLGEAQGKAIRQATGVGLFGSAGRFRRPRLRILV